MLIIYACLGNNSEVRNNESRIKMSICTEDDKITVDEFDGLVEKLANFRKTLDEKKLETKVIADEADALERKLMAYLEENNRTSYKSPNGTVSIMHKWRVNLPATDEDKAALFEHLRERGLFERYATVNSNSLNSLFLQDWETAKERGEGMEFKMPGVGEAKLNKVLSFRKA